MEWIARKLLGLAHQVGRDARTHGGKTAGTHVGGVGLGGGYGLLAQIGIEPNEGGHAILGEAEHIVTDQHLAIAMRTCADADGGDVQVGRDGFGDGGGNGLQDYGKRAGCFEGLGIGQQLIGVGWSRRGLLAVSAELMDVDCGSNPK